MYTSDPFETIEQEGVHRTYKRVFWATLFLVAVGLSYWLGRLHAYYDMPPARSTAASVAKYDNNASNASVDFSLFWDAWDVLKKRYVDRGTLDDQRLLYGAIDGMLAATDDPYTTFFDPEELKSFNEEITGSFEGIGAEIGVRDGVLTIIAPLEGSPAEKAGLRPSDLILKIDDTFTADLNIQEAVDLIRGPRGTPVVLSIYRKGADHAKDVTVIRDKIFVKSITYSVEQGHIGYIRMRRFGPHTADDFYRVAREIVGNPDITSLVIDVRNNPGGYLNSAVDVAGMMLPQGAVVVMSEDAAGERKVLRARQKNFLGHLPTVVLINEGSASASEILAGALKDNRNDVRIVGRKSFGKGSVQELIPLKDGAIKVTIAKWLTPSGKQINKVGITPDEDVEISDEDFDAGRDPQKERALEIAREMAQ